MQHHERIPDSPGISYLWRRGVLYGIARLTPEGWHIENIDPPPAPGTSDVHHPAIGVEDGLVHHLGERGMREDRVHELGLGGLERARDRVALDELGDLGADHVRAEQLAGLGIEDGLDEPLGVAERDRLAIADIGKARWNEKRRQSGR